MWSFVINFFTQHNVSKGSPSVSVYQSFVYGYCQILFHCTDNHSQFSLSSVDGHLGCSHFGAIMNNVAMDIYVQVLQTDVFISLGYIHKSRIAGSIFNSLRNCRAVFKVLHHLTFPPVMYNSSSFSTSLPTFIIICLSVLAILEGAHLLHFNEGGFYVSLPLCGQIGFGTLRCTNISHDSWHN